MKPRGYVAIAVMTSWGVGIAVFARREAGRSPLERLAEVAARVAPGATWLAVERDGTPIGFQSITVDTLPRELQVTDYLVANGGGVSERRSAQTVVRLTRGLSLRAFEQTVVQGADTVHLTGGVVNDSVLSYELQHGAQHESGTLVHRGILFPGPLIPIVAALGERPTVGRSITIDAVDVDAWGQPASAAVTLRVAAESLFVVVDSAAHDPSRDRWVAVHRDSVRGWRYLSVDGKHDFWLDDLGRILASRGGDGLSARRTAFEIAFENWRLANPLSSSAARTSSDISTSTLVAAGADGDYEAIDTLQLRVITQSPAARSLARESRTGSLVTSVRTSDSVLVAENRLPLTDALRRSRGIWLRREPRIEVDDPSILRLAARLGAGESDPVRVARAAVSWVSDSVARDATLPTASAVETLQHRRGDSGEHARLFVALARAAGIPARGVTGLLFANGRFYNHAWAEVLIGDRFVPVDPTLGQLPADAGHLAWMHGSLEGQAEVARLMAPVALQLVRVAPSHTKR